MNLTYHKIDVNTFFDKIFYINIDSRTDRNELMIDNFKRFGITNYERVSGIKFDTLPDKYLYRNFINSNSKYTLGQLGCREAHVNCIKLAKERGYKNVFILEDDIQFLQNPNDILTYNSPILENWDMLYFGGLIEQYFRNQIVMAHAYCVNSILFDDIINMANPSGMEIDNFYAKIIHHMSCNHINIGKYRIVPLQPFNTIIQDKKYNSDIS